MGPQDTFSPASLQVWEVHRSPFKARNFKALLRYIQKLLLGDGVGGVLGAEGWGGGADCGFHSGEVEGSRPRCPSLLSCFWRWLLPHPLWSSWKIGVTLYGVSVSTLTWQLRIRGSLGLSRSEESALTLHVLT